MDQDSNTQNAFFEAFTNFVASNDDYKNAQEITKSVLSSSSNPEQQVVSLTNALSNWIQTAAMYARNAEWYKGLLEEIAVKYHPEAFTDDTGVIHEDPFVSKLPELINPKNFLPKV